ncbi:MAG: hypothetical protein L6W00_18595 [Lentisphaeria bacterium]|nr:MAG: hypothetical protein L6W00_18595 [Lentisphaeria bacterium]
MKLFCRRWLLHENPYTGMVWGRDPALFQVSLVNEGNLDFFWNTTAETERLYREKIFPLDGGAISSGIRDGFPLGTPFPAVSE